MDETWRPLSTVQQDDTVGSLWLRILMAHSASHAQLELLALYCQSAFTIKRR